MNLPPSECRRTLLMTCQHWFRWWLSAFRQQTITWTNVDPDLCCHMAPLGHNVLRACGWPITMLIQICVVIWRHKVTMFSGLVEGLSQCWSRFVSSYGVTRTVPLNMQLIHKSLTDTGINCPCTDIITAEGILFWVRGHNISQVRGQRSGFPLAHKMCTNETNDL